MFILTVALLYAGPAPNSIQFTDGGSGTLTIAMAVLALGTLTTVLRRTAFVV